MPLTFDRAALRLLERAAPSPTGFLEPAPALGLRCPACAQSHPAPVGALLEVLDELAMSPQELLCPACGWANALDDWVEDLRLAQPA
ncbi:MAG: hypothetical protein H6741_05100 [Alphaproteobacteria bacterium]|nr:hypothetical protein [Alphaproteobacteria bacterium]MCB9792083.1 hypothetical protein [Alphaproteobacteria bacterium]